MATPKSKLLKQEVIFAYKAIDTTKKPVSGEIKAVSEAIAKAYLRKQGFEKIQVYRKFQINFFSGLKKVKPADVTNLTRQLATLSMAGIPIVQSLDVIADGSNHNGLRELIKKVKTEIESGNSLSNSFRKFPEAFDPLYCNLIEAGENSGNLDTMLERIATYREKTESLKRKIKKALTYPTVVVFVAMIVSTILLVKVVPTFQDMFKGFGAELPYFTQQVINLSELIQAYGIWMLGGIIGGGIFFVYAYRRNEHLRNLMDKLLLMIPVFGPLIRKAIVTRFTRTLSTTFAAGVPLPDALIAAAKTCGNYIYFKAIMKTHELVLSGQKMHLSMAATGEFPNLVIQMIGIGEESGTLEIMLNKVSAIYEEEVDIVVDGLSSLIEPMIMVFLGVVVGGLVVAMYLPIFKLGSVV